MKSELGLQSHIIYASIIAFSADFRFVLWTGFNQTILIKFCSWRVKFQFVIFKPSRIAKLSFVYTQKTDDSKANMLMPSAKANIWHYALCGQRPVEKIVCYLFPRFSKSGIDPWLFLYQIEKISF